MIGLLERVVMQYGDVNISSVAAAVLARSDDYSWDRISRLQLALADGQSAD